VLDATDKVGEHALRFAHNFDVAVTLEDLLPDDA